MRQTLLGSVLSQKMGLFYHSQPVDQELANHVTSMVTSSAPLGSTGTPVPTASPNPATPATGQNRPPAKGGKPDQGPNMPRQSATGSPASAVVGTAAAAAGGLARAASGSLTPNPAPIGLKFNRFKAMPSQIPVSVASSTSAQTQSAGSGPTSGSATPGTGSMVHSTSGGSLAKGTLN